VELRVGGNVSVLVTLTRIDCSKQSFVAAINVSAQLQY
jgi:hypothetical protein